MTTPDPERLGGLAWTRRTNGVLDTAERRRLLGRIARAHLHNLAGRARLLAGRRPRIDVDDRLLDPPDSQLARLAEDAAADQPAWLLAHAYRTWGYGVALASLDHARLDREAFYVAALLHDFGLVTPTAGRDFTLAGADRAGATVETAGLPSELATTIADAISVHTTPGVDPARDGALGTYLQHGAMVDVAGMRVWDLPALLVDRVLSRNPRGPFSDELVRCWKAEAAAVPRGRFALLARWGALPLAIRIAPFRG